MLELHNVQLNRLALERQRKSQPKLKLLLGNLGHKKGNPMQAACWPVVSQIHDDLWCDTKGTKSVRRLASETTSLETPTVLNVPFPRIRPSSASHRRQALLRTNYYRIWKSRC